MRKLLFLITPLIVFGFYLADDAKAACVPGHTDNGDGTCTATFYPDANPETFSVDGIVSQEYSSGGGQLWSTIRTAAGSEANDTAGSGQFIILWTDSVGGTPKWRQLRRGIFLFDTSELPNGAAISAATLSIYGTAKTDGLSISPDVNVYSATPNSNTALVTSDYAQTGGNTPTALATAITYIGWNTAGYNDWTFNASGISAISKIGVSKFSVRNANYDASGSAPTWGLGSSSFSAYYADQIGTAQDPRLEVIYTSISAPTVTTQAASNLGETFATGNGNITDTGGEDASEQGVEWGTTLGGPYPNSATDSGSFSVGAFTKDMTGLSPGTTYYYRAKAYNLDGWGYGSEQSFTTVAPPVPPYQSYNVSGYAWSENIGWLRFQGPVISDNGLVASWSMDEGTGSQIFDASGNGHTGTLTNMIDSDWVDGKYGTGLDFDGGNDYVNCGNSASLTSNLNTFSVEAWVKYDGSGNFAPLIGFGDLFTFGLFLKYNNGDPMIALNSSNYQRFDKGDLWDGNLHHVVFVVTGNGQDDILNSKFYIDGVPRPSTGGGNGNAPQVKSYFHIGKARVNEYYLNGIADEVRVYNKVLSQFEIQDHYNGYGVNIELGSGDFSGFAWSDMVMGWLKFSGVGYGVVGPPNLFNDPPVKPTLNDEISEHCAINGESLYVFSWNYSDPDNDLQVAYEIQMDENSGFAIPMFNHMVNSAGTSYTLDLSQDDDPPDPGGDWLSELNWNATYFWRVRVKDSVGNWSDWSNSDQLKTPKQAYPWPAFSWEPLEPVQKEVVIFTPDELDEDEFNYFWDFGTGTPADGTGPTNSQPHVFFEAYDNTVKLTITRISDGDFCEREEDVTAQLPLPEYKEVSPIAWIKDAWGNVLAFLSSNF